MIHGRVNKFGIAAAVFFCTLIVQASPKIEAMPGEFLIKVSDKKAFHNALSAGLFSSEKMQTVSKKQNIFLVKRNILEKSDFAISSLSKTPGVALVEPNYIYRINKLPDDPQFEDLWGLKNQAKNGGREGIDVGAEAAWDIQTGSENVVIAVIDTGLDYTHPDIAANAWTNQAEAEGQAGVDDDGNGYVDDIHGYDFVNEDGDPMDDHGHGTHVSGTIGAKGNDGKGIVGVNWDVRIVGVKFLSAGGSGTLANAVRAIDYATATGARVQSNSWGGGGYSELLKESIERANAKDILFVAAAGNESNNNDAAPTYPCTYDVANVLSVAAIDNSGALAYFSNYGRTKVHVAAPGVAVTSSVPKDTEESGYATWSGTSMATPHVSGIAGLLLAQDATLSAAALKEKIIASSRTLGTLRNKVVSAGVANAYYALSGESAPVDEEDPYNWEATDYSTESAHPYDNNITQDYTVTVDGASQISVYFEKFETERGYDLVEFIDAGGNVVARWSGYHNEEFSPVISGNTVTLRFKTDESVVGFGFQVTKVAYK